MEQQATPLEIRWPKFLDAPLHQRKRVIAAVCPMVLDDVGPCFAVTLNQRWLCGSGGERTCFDSIAAAARFLHLMKVSGFVFEAPRAVVARDQGRFQCFRLSSRGLTSCDRCRIGECALLREAQEYARQQDRW